MSKSFIVVTIIAATSASAAVYLSQELRTERQQRRELLTRITDLESKLAARAAASQISAAPNASLPESQPPRETQAQAPATIASRTPAMAAVGRVGAMDPEMRRRMQEGHEQQVRMLKDPEYRELMRSQYKMGMQQMHSDLQALMDLSEHEKEQLIDVLAEQSLRNMEQRPAFGFDGSPPDEAQLRERQRLAEEQRRRNEVEIQAVLGSKYGEWQQYQQNGWSRAQVMNLRQALSTTNEPLRQEQVKPLVEAIAREQAQLARPDRAIAAGTEPDPQTHVRLAEQRLQRTAQSHERIRAAVSGLLTPAQYAQLERQQQQELRMHELSLKQQRARLEAQARGEIPPDSPNASNAVISFSH